MLKINYRILVVDDDFEFHKNLRLALREGYLFEGARDEFELRKKLNGKDTYDLILLDLDLHGNEDVTVGLNLIPELGEKFPDIPIIVITKESKISVVIEAINKGAKTYLHKKELDYKLWDKQFRTIIENRDLHKENIKLKQETAILKHQISQSYPFIGETTQVLEIKRTLTIVSEEPEITVLLTGETGTGKEVAARFLHQQGARRDGPFVGVNLSAIPKEMLESELFGHKKGSFTNAEFDKEGYFRQANGGVLLLDEIGDVNADIQIKLLRFLETRLIRPIGWDQDIQLDVQIVTATHRNLREEVASGNFREDLYQRLKAMVIYIPALRERREDIPLIIRHYLKQQSYDEQIIPPEVMAMLLNYHWPGNIRELVNSIRSMMMRRKILNRDAIDPECLPEEIRAFVPGTIVHHTENHAPIALTIPEGNHSLEEQQAILELRRIEASLIQYNGIKKDVAFALGYDKAGKSDNLNYCITSFYSKFPHLFSSFPVISKKYKRYIKPTDLL